MPDRYFTKQTFSFLSSLADNNTREWFEEHKQDYEDFVREPALDFISDMAEEMPAISKHFLAVPKKVGGSLMRVQRNLRFSRDKTPYKTNIGIQFRHEVGKDIHAPGYYVHIAPDECFVAVGLWHPEADVLFKIREGILQNGDAWVAARDNKAFSKHFSLEGDSLDQRAARLCQGSSAGGGLEAQGFHRPRIIEQDGGDLERFSHSWWWNGSSRPGRSCASCAARWNCSSEYNHANSELLTRLARSGDPRYLAERLGQFFYLGFQFGRSFRLRFQLG